MFFFFKQRTAYEMRISDWSSDVCSSDLLFLSLPEAPMADTSPFAQLIAFVSKGVAAIRHSGEDARAPVYGVTPAIPQAKPQGRMPTLKMPTAKGWEGEHKQTAAAGVKVKDRIG